MGVARGGLCLGGGDLRQLRLQPALQFIEAQRGPGPADPSRRAAALLMTPVSMMRCTCLRGPPVTQAASLAVNLQGAVATIVYLSSTLEEI